MASQSENKEYFPRSPDLSDHSPLFWISNKDRFLRQLLIRDIEKLTGRQLCVYSCSNYFRTSFSTDDVGRLFEIVNSTDGQAFDLLLETSGGDTDATEGLVSMLQEINRNFRVVVPSRAKSNGTVICLASKSIVMGVTSELGPIEPFLNNRPVSILMDPYYKRTNFVLHKAAVDAFNQTSKLADSLLKEGMLSELAENERKSIVKKLCTRDHFHSHGSVINANEAKELGLSVDYLPASSEIWKRLWLLHGLYAHDSVQQKIGKFFEGRSRSLSIRGDDPTSEREHADGDDR